MKIWGQMGQIIIHNVLVSLKIRNIVAESEVDCGYLKIFIDLYSLQ